MKKLFLLDAYALIYRAYYGFIKNPRINSKGENTSAVLGFVNTLEEVLNKENPDYIAVAFDPHGPTFRHEAFPEYKAQREETPEGIRFAVPIIKEILKAKNIPVLELPGYEADDIIGTFAKKAESIEDLSIYMMTPDKDYGQLVSGNVKMYKPRHDGGFDTLGEMEIKEKYGIERTEQVIDLLGLMGDSADNFPGCPGVGEKTAVKLINQFGSIEEMLGRTSEIKGALRTKVEQNVDNIRMSLFLARIKTDVPIELNIESMARQETDKQALSAIYEQLEFRQHLNKLNGVTTGSEKSNTTASTTSGTTATKTKRGKKQAASLMGDLFAPQPVQGDLFGGEITGEFAGNGQGNENFSPLASLKDIPHEYYLVDSEEKIEQLIAKLLTAEIISLDTETTSTNPMFAELVGLSFAMKENEAYYVPLPFPYPSKYSSREKFLEANVETLKILKKFEPVYANEKILKVGQNLKYDLTVLRNYGIEVRGEMFDTMIAHYLLMPELQHGMDYMADTLLHYRTIHFEEILGKNHTLRTVPQAEICDYAAEDADVTLKLYNVLKPKLEEQGLWSLFHDIEMPLMPVLMRMEMNGARIDSEALAETSRLFTEKMRAIEADIKTVAGETINPNSPKQIGELLFDKLHLLANAKRTKTGQYVTSEEVLQAVKAKHPVVGKILEYRGYKKLLSTYVDALPQLVNPLSGRIHTSYNQTVTTTGRLSSSSPNLQNIPIRDENGKEVRKAFIPEEGNEFFSADYSQIELRLMAHLSGDKNMIEDFNSGNDIHRATASKIFKVPLEEVTSDMRRKAKTANFGIIYGISAFGLAERMEVSRTEAKQLIDDYFATYPAVKEYMDRSIEKARQKGYTETLLGRRCQLPDINSHNSVVRGYAERNAINAPIQGTAADIIKIAMIRIDHRMQQEGMKSKMILQVHDELNFSVLPEEHEQLERLVREEMQAAITLNVPLLADCGWGKNWLEAH